MNPSSFFWKALPGPQFCANCAGNCRHSTTKYLPQIVPMRSPGANRNVLFDVAEKNGGMPSSVMYVRFRSQETRDVHVILLLVMSGTLSETSHVLFSNSPAFFHCDEKPDETDGGTCKI